MNGFQKSVGVSQQVAGATGGDAEEPERGAAGGDQDNAGAKGGEQDAAGNDEDSAGNDQGNKLTNG